MALIKCPECESEISDTVTTCINCGYKLKYKKLNKKVMITIICVIAVVVSVLFVMKDLSAKETYPQVMKVLNQSYVSDVIEILGDGYETASSSTAKFYVYNNLELDGIIYDEIHITELKNTGSLYEIGFEFYVDELSEMEKYAEEISKYYGEYEERENAMDDYDWKTAKTLNPSIWIYGNASPYKIYIMLN